MLKRNEKGMSLIEVFISAFVFVLAVGAIFVTLNSMRKPAVNNDNAVEAALVGQKVLEDLRAKIDQRDFDLSTNTYSGSGGEISDLKEGSHLIENIGPGNMYTVNYYVTNSSTTGALKVDANVTWPDAL